MTSNQTKMRTKFRRLDLNWKHRGLSAGDENVRSGRAGPSMYAQHNKRHVITNFDSTVSKTVNICQKKICVLDKNVSFFLAPFIRNIFNAVNTLLYQMIAKNARKHVRYFRPILVKNYKL
jgi:hypothetical protein